MSIHVPIFDNIILGKKNPFPAWTAIQTRDVFVDWAGYRGGLCPWANEKMSGAGLPGAARGPCAGGKSLLGLGQGGRTFGRSPWSWSSAL